MKLTLFTRSLERGGAERQLVTLAAELAARNHDVEVLTMYDGGALAEELHRLSIPCVSLGKRSRWHLLGLYAGLIKHLRQRSPDAILSYLVAPNILAALSRPFVPRTRLVQGLRASNMDFRFYGGFEEWTFQLGRRLASAADRIIVNSRSGVTFHASQGFPVNRLVCIPNGIDAGRYRFDPQGRVRVRDEWGIDTGTPLVGIVARLDPMKDHLTFLGAASRLIETHPQARFVIVGDGPADYVVRLKASPDALGLADRVQFVGSRDDMASVYSALDVGTLSSRFGEGFPNSVAEGLACELPTVVTDVGDAAWIVDRDDRVVPPESPAALAESWRRILIASQP
ncbi:MAG: glycosyltransferase, partial [Acidobacteriota bacterium]|nr:glycosyltransferase [Acidobacteriota bacterium]